LFDEGDGFHGQEKTCGKQERENAEKGDEKAIGPIIPFAEKHVKRCKPCADERHKEPRNRSVIRLSEMKEFHGPPTSGRFAFKIRQNRSFVKRGIPDASDARRCAATIEGYGAIHCKKERALARREGDAADEVLRGDQERNRLHRGP